MHDSERGKREKRIGVVVLAGRMGCWRYWPRAYTDLLRSGSNEMGHTTVRETYIIYLHRCGIPNDCFAFMLPDAFCGRLCACVCLCVHARRIAAHIKNGLIVMQANIKMPCRSSDSEQTATHIHSESIDIAQKKSRIFVCISLVR